MRAKSWARCVALVLLAVVGPVVVGVSPASAHTELVSTDPAEGAEIERLPEVVRLTFSERVRLVADGIHVFDPEGAELAASATTSDEDLLVTIDDEVARGTVVVAWRVVSADGHPLAGSLSFSVGAPSTATLGPESVDAPRSVSVALSLSRWPAYA